MDLTFTFSFFSHPTRSSKDGTSLTISNFFLSKSETVAEEEAAVHTREKNGDSFRASQLQRTRRSNQELENGSESAGSATINGLQQVGRRSNNRLRKKPDNEPSSSGPILENGILQLKTNKQSSQQPREQRKTKSKKGLIKALWWSVVNWL